MTKKQSRIAERGSIIGTPAVDYLTITTFNTEQHQMVVNWLRESHPHAAIKTARSHAYDLETAGWGSWGDGMQKDQPHHIVSINGKDAHELYIILAREDAFRPEEWNCSRVDLQVTVEHSREVRLSALAQLYHAGEFGEFRGRGRPAVRAIAGSDGDTLYVGSPTSEKMLRFYDKPLLVKGRRVNHERMEVQLRDSYALGVWKRLFERRPEPNTPAMLGNLTAEFNKLPEAMAASLAAVKVLTEGHAEPIEPSVSDREDAAKLKWFRTATPDHNGPVQRRGGSGPESAGSVLASPGGERQHR